MKIVATGSFSLGKNSPISCVDAPGAVCWGACVSVGSDILHCSMGLIHNRASLLLDVTMKPLPFLLSEIQMRLCVGDSFVFLTERSKIDTTIR